MRRRRLKNWKEITIKNPDMKKILYIILFYASLHYTNAQTPNLDKLLQKISLEKNDSSRFYLAFSGLTVSETNPVLDMGNAEIILVHGQKTNDRVCQVLGLACLGYDYRAFGNTARSLEYNLKAKVVAENSKGLGALRNSSISATLRLRVSVVLIFTFLS